MDPLTSNPARTEPLLELDFPERSLLFFKNTQKVLKGELLLELPNQQDGGNETVLKTYDDLSAISVFNNFKVNACPGLYASTFPKMRMPVRNKSPIQSNAL